MAMKVGCAMADRIAAIAPVGAARPKTMVCLPTRPVSVVMINGTSDPVVPYGGGTEHNLQLPNRLRGRQCEGMGQDQSLRGEANPDQVAGS